MKRLPLLITLVLAAVFITGYLFWSDGLELRFVPNRSTPRDVPLNFRSIEEMSADFDLAGGPEIDGRGFPQREIIDLASEFPGIVFNRGSSKVKKVALTFDDGPDKVFTPRVLDVLKQYNVKATFFVVGKRAKIHPDIMRRMVREGHVIANHSWSHPNIMKLTPDKIKEEIIKNENFLNNLTGYKPALFRSPYGSLGRDEVRQINSYGYKIIAWNVDSLDWKSLSGEQVRSNILENVKKGSIILQHSAGGKGEDLSGTVEALPGIIKTLKKDGYQFVTIPELLNIPKQKLSGKNS